MLRHELVSLQVVVLTKEIIMSTDVEYNFLVTTRLKPLTRLPGAVPMIYFGNIKSSVKVIEVSSITGLE